ncbi:hypothetical protein [Alkalibaculum bacchi]|mgnify:CR=1 FL=1|nr:hypothetical protein [Alkalibaculum bacchi]
MQLLLKIYQVEDLMGKGNHSKSKYKNKGWLDTLKSIVICGVFGGVLGFFIGDFFNPWLKSDNIFIGLLKFYGLIILFVIGYIIHIIIHEAGHLIFGLLTDYTFVSFRIGSITIVKEDGKLKTKKFNIPGTAGQCLMMPPKIKDGEFPFVLYNLGGVIINLLVSALCISTIVLIKEMAFVLEVILLLAAFAGILAAVTNGIPMKIGGVPNDGHNIYSMLKDEDARRGFYVQLEVNGLQSLGIRMKELPLSKFVLNNNADVSQPLNTAMRLMEYSYHLDHLDIESAKTCLLSLTEHMDRIALLFVNEINCERLFLELVTDCDKSTIDRLYNKKLKKYIKASRFQMSKKRLMMAYEIYYTKDINKALQFYKEGKNLASNSPVKGDADMELMLLDWLKVKLL